MGMYRALFMVGLIMAIAFLIATIVLFFVLKIPKAIGVVTGRTQRKAIEEIREGGYEARSKKEAISSSGKRIHVRDVEMDTGTLHKGATSGGLNADKAEKAAATAVKKEEKSVFTAEAAQNSRPNRDRSKAYEETEVLDFTATIKGPGSKPEGDDTEVLGNENASRDGDATDVLPGIEPADSRAFSDEDATDVLNITPEVPGEDEIIGRYSAEETAVLRSMHVTAEEEKSDKRDIKVLYKETIVHTDESL